MQFGMEEVKLSLFSGDVTLHLENLKETTPKNIYVKTQFHFYTLSMNKPKITLRK